MLNIKNNFNLGSRINVNRFNASTGGVRPDKAGTRNKASTLAEPLDVIKENNKDDAHNSSGKETSRSQVVQSRDHNAALEDDSSKVSGEKEFSYDNDYQDEHDSEDKHSDNEDPGLDILKYGDMKDDRKIVKNPTLNERYNLVERPRFLLQFELKDKETDF